MKAVVFHKTGGSDKLQLTQMPDPTPGAGEAVVRVRACGVNRLDILVRTGFTPVKVPMPHIGGSEVTGEVVQVGPGVSSVGVGDRVAVAPYLYCGSCEYCLAGHESVCPRGDILGLVSQGGYAELVKVPAQSLVPLPDGVSFQDGAAVTLAALTAYHMLVTKARIQPGEDVLVLAGGSGVGSAAIQLAKLMGARVIATAGSEAKLEKARQLGADAVVSHASGSFRQEVRALTGKRGVDVVVEHVGQATWHEAVGCLARGGRLVTCGAFTGAKAEMDIWGFFAKELTFIGAYGGSRAELAQVLKLVRRGALVPIVDRVYGLDGVAAAQQALEENQPFGKLIIEP